MYNHRTTIHNLYTRVPSCSTAPGKKSLSPQPAQFQTVRAAPSEVQFYRVRGTGFTRLLFTFSCTRKTLVSALILEGEGGGREGGGREGGREREGGGGREGGGREGGRERERGREGEGGGRELTWGKLNRRKGENSINCSQQKNTKEQLHFFFSPSMRVFTR